MVYMKRVHIRSQFEYCVVLFCKRFECAPSIGTVHHTSSRIIKAAMPKQRICVIVRSCFPIAAAYNENTKHLHSWNKIKLNINSLFRTKI